MNGATFLKTRARGNSAKPFHQTRLSRTKEYKDEESSNFSRENNAALIDFYKHKFNKKNDGVSTFDNYMQKGSSS